VSVLCTVQLNRIFVYFCLWCDNFDVFVLIFMSVVLLVTNRIDLNVCTPLQFEELFTNSV